MAVALDRIQPADAQRLGLLAVQERVLARPAGQAALLQPQHEHGLEAAGTGTAQVEHLHPAGAAAEAAVAGALQLGDQAGPVGRRNAAADDLGQLLERAQRGAKRGGVSLAGGGLANGGEAAGGGAHAAQLVAHLAGGVARLGHPVRRGQQPRVVQLFQHLAHLVVAQRPAPAQPALGIVDGGAGDAGER